MSHNLVVEPRSVSGQFAVRVHFFNQYQYFISFDCDLQLKTTKISFHIMTQHARHRPKPEGPQDTFIHIVCTSFGYFLFSSIGKINANCDSPNCFPVPLQLGTFCFYAVLSLQKLKRLGLHCCPCCISRCQTCFLELVLRGIDLKKGTT